VVGPVRWAKDVKTTPFMRWLERGIQFDFGSISGDQASWAHLYGANCSMKRDLLEAVGGYDEENLPYGYEDLELGYRARAHGLRVLYNRRAAVDHVRHDMTLDFWRKRIRRAAVAERRFVSLHPELTPHLHTLFTSALSHPPARGRGARLARFVPPRLPLVGRRVWGPAELYWQQQLAPEFLDAWEQAATDGPAPPDLGERQDLGDGAAGDFMPRR
jgi:GT2 family glycosyltransferase